MAGEWQGVVAGSSPFLSDGTLAWEVSVDIWNESVRRTCVTMYGWQNITRVMATNKDDHDGDDGEIVMMAIGGDDEVQE